VSTADLVLISTYPFDYKPDIFSLPFLFFFLKGFLGRPRTIPDYHAFGNEIEQTFKGNRSKMYFFPIVNEFLFVGA